MSLTSITGSSAENLGTVQTQSDNISTVQGNNDTQLNSNESTATQSSADENVTNTTDTTTDQTTKNSTVQNTTQTTNQSILTAANLHKSEAAAGTTKTITTTFTIAQIKSAAVKLKSYIETNHKLPNYVTIGTTQILISNFLKLMSTAIVQISAGTKTTQTLKTVSTCANPTETVKSGNILKSEYLNIAQSIETSIASTGKAPSYINSTLGKINFNNLVYTFSKILNFQNTNNRLPNYVSVTSWTNVTNASTVPEGVDLRPVYIVSDNINNLQADTARINALISDLAQLGIKAYNMGIGPQMHDSVLSNPNIPKNAVIVEIAGGVDAGCILEKGSTWYKNLLGTKTDFLAITAGATSTIGGYINNDITGLAWLPRASDDDYDSASFTGIAYPAQYLLNNGIHYYAGLTNNNMVQCAEAIYNVAI